VSQQIQHQSADVRVRRAPKFGAFMVVGGGLGAIVTLILTSLFPSDPNVGFIALFAYFCLYGIPAGVVLGALVALILDRRSSKRARTVAAEHESVEPPAE
jgi:NhaP-type Na+/H+ or K+/H+ antiporter